MKQESGQAGQEQAQEQEQLSMGGDEVGLRGQGERLAAERSEQKMPGIGQPPNGNAQQRAQSPPLSGAVRVGNTLYISGQGGLDMEFRGVAGSDLETQVVFTMRHIEKLLDKAGMTFADVVRANVYLSDRSLYASFNELYRRYFTEPYPARTVVYCELNYDLLVEIDVIAVVGEQKVFY